MSKGSSGIFKLLKRIFRYFVFIFLGLFILLNVFIVVSGRFYLYKGAANTYLVGKTGPGIYDLDIFPYKSIATGEKIPWVEKKDLDKVKLSVLDKKYLESLGTKGFLVIHNDTLLFEKYFDEHKKATVSNSFSAGKTIVALLIGIAIEEGRIKSLDEPVGNYIPEFSSGKHSKITIRHLLDMASGLDWTESGKDPLSDNAASYYGSDLYGLTTDQEVIKEPGRTFIYQSGNTQLLGFVIKAATGSTVAEYTQEKIWKRIGAEQEAYWSLDREDGDEKAFCCFYATVRDFARFGVLFVNNGKFGNEQIVPEWFMKEMVRFGSTKTEEGTPNQRYGLHVWVYDDGKSPVYYLRGIKGQYIIAVPDKNLIIVRVGEERLPDVSMPENKLMGKKELKSLAQKVGHAPDFLEYLRIGKRIASKK
jgi:CubicO group peptidase (beta-lactamase class C family)